MALLPLICSSCHDRVSAEPHDTVPAEPHDRVSADPVAAVPRVGHRLELRHTEPSTGDCLGWSTTLYKGTHAYQQPMGNWMGFREDDWPEMSSLVSEDDLLLHSHDQPSCL